MANFSLKTKNSKQLLNFFATANILTDEATIQLTPENLNIRMMDPSRVAMIDAFLGKNVFEEYVCEQPQKIAVNMNEFLKILKRAGKEDQTKIALTPKNRLEVTFIGQNNRQFTLPLLEPDENSIPIPKINFNTTAKLVASGLNMLVEDAQLVTDHVQFQSEPDTLKMQGNGDLMTLNSTLQKGNTLLELEVKEPSKATYSLSYISEIMKAATTLSDLAKLEFASDMPLKLDFLLQDACLTFFLAPRIETEG